ncbi:MAG: hypothetical protein ACR2Q4_20700 [Geminicoccaceae bacterium]
MSALGAAGSAKMRETDSDRPDDDQVRNNVAALKREPELERLTALADDLQASLDKSNRRVDRLLGERNQLTNLLDKRDEQVQRLNRELGSRGASHSSVVPGFGGIGNDRQSRRGLGEWVRNWRERLLSRLQMTSSQRAEEAAQAAGIECEVAGNDDSDTDRRPPIIAHCKTSSSRLGLAVIMFGLTKAEIEQLLPTISRDCSAKGMMPLVLTDNDAFEILREQGIIFEYLPPAQDRERFDDRLCWDLYIQRRLALIRQKWQPVRVVAFGQVAVATLSLWQESPFEKAPLPTPSGA